MKITVDLSNIEDLEVVEQNDGNMNSVRIKYGAVEVEYTSNKDIEACREQALAMFMRRIFRPQLKTQDISNWVLGF